MKKCAFEMRCVCKCGYSISTFEYWSDFDIKNNLPVCPHCGEDYQSFTKKPLCWVPRQRIIVGGYWEDEKGKKI